MASYGLLGQPEEGRFHLSSPSHTNANVPAITDALHKSRLLNVEEKPFKRISKRLLNPESLIISQSSLPLTPPPEDTDPESDATAAEAEKQKRLEEWRHFREDVSLDFAAFEGSIARVQFLLTSNEQERQRYATERVQILSKMQSVRESTTDLRSQLEEAQRLLSLRKTYDELTDKITSNRLLKPREDQSANLQKLRLEIADLEKESKDYAKTWSERREQFGRIVDEGMQLRRLIRDEKEEVERREGMQEGVDGDEGEVTSKGKSSSGNTPGPDSDAMTPSHQSQDEGSRSSALQVGKPGTARGASPLRHVTAAQIDGVGSHRDDTNMLDEGEISVVSDGELSELEEGEELPDDFNEKMDTT
ncbi:hypothetical protein N7475_003147 [Penicillium sp. IBT 31633x]|nr:hypothetical protein N7475_003147 [Penicillium sp. IBT 31633x]